MPDLSGHAYDWTMMEGSSVEPPTLLLISADDELARELTEALHWCVLARWVDEDAAVEWLEANRCDLCLLDRDRIETLLRIRLRRPGMPIIKAGEEQPERAGLATFVPGRRELIEATARQVSELLRPGPRGTLRKSSRCRYRVWRYRHSSWSRPTRTGSA